ncbi:MAG: zinc ribbon domain-containing protein [Gammaproteobacteria bacterium]|nr:zinc ribbon domain-containing protein [Gammaproteobacteria bacterium]
MTAFCFFGTISPVPIYVYRCKTCGEVFEEIQKVGAEPPESPTETERCPEATTLADRGADDPESPSPCQLERQLTTAGHRFRPDYSSDGLGGYTRQGDAMVRQISGKSGQDYGTDRSGRS